MASKFNWYTWSFLGQCGFFVLLVIIVGFLDSKGSAISALLGGLAYFVPSSLTGLYVSHFQYSSNVLLKAYTGVIARLILSSCLLILIFEKTNSSAGIVISCFCLAAVVQYVMSFIFINHEG